MARLTQATFIAKILSGKEVPDNETIAKAVRKQFPGCAVTAKTVNWYITKYRLGELQGQDGEPGHKIRRDDLPAIRRTKKTKRVVKKKRRTR